jgi:hypothetical protein
MYALLIVLIAVLFVAVKVMEARREHMSAIKVGTSGVSTDIDGPGYELVSFYPNTCAQTDELQLLLCYTRCRPGYHGVGPVCWADTENVGIGTPVGLEPCPDGWSNDGLICREPLRCASGWKFFTEGCSGGRLKGRLNDGGVCPGPGGGNDRTERIAGLCYRKCPKSLPERVFASPYLCYKGGDLAYGRGVGTVPPLVRFLGGKSIV